MIKLSKYMMNKKIVFLELPGLKQVHGFLDLYLTMEM